MPNEHPSPQRAHLLRSPVTTRRGHRARTGLFVVAIVGLVLATAGFAFLTDVGWSLAGRLTGLPAPGHGISFLRPPLEVDKVVLDHDQDADGVKDLADIVAGARAYVADRPRYRSAYYAGGYPPEGEGVCTDVIWKALQAAGYDLKKALDEDIKAHPADYPRVGGKPDPNIDFRRVQNLAVFFQKYGVTLTEKVVPWDKENLKEWQGGDIVVFGRSLDHIGIVSDRRRADGVPYLIHNAGPWGTEDDSLTTWPTGIRYHLRFPRSAADQG